MKISPLKILFGLNYFLLILYMSWHINMEQNIFENYASLAVSSLILIDITYISACNIKNNKIISLFCGILTMDSWYIVMSFAKSTIEKYIFIALSPIILYLSIRFVLVFLFQGSGYKFRKPINITLSITCIGSLIGVVLSSRAYACLYGIQFLLSCLCLLLIIVYHWKRVSFVLKSEWRSLLFSVAIISISFLLYYFATLKINNHLSNFGVYLIALLFLMSIHGIIWKGHNSYPLSSVFSKTQTVFLIGLSLFTLGTILLFMGGSYKELLIAINVLFFLIYICNIILEISQKNGEVKLIKESKYNEALRQLQQANLLKAEFANFLHDDILQDLLSIKNMMTKAYRPDIQDIIIETLDSLNIHIRNQMQDYHPVILQNLTIKENYQNLVEAVSQTFPQQEIVVSLDCPDNLFLVEPYNVFVYRILKELLTNVFKHSDGHRAWITLTQESGRIELSVSDDGNANADSLNERNQSTHKGISSIKEQLINLNGSMIISNNIPHGVNIHIVIPMKGDVSYQYFIS